MAPPSPQIAKQIDFSKGIYAGVNRYGQPPGTIRYASNFVFDRTGALSICDGSLIQSSPGGAGATANQLPIRWMTRYAQTGQLPYLYALLPDGTTIHVVDVTLASWSGYVLNMTSSYATPSMLQAGDFLAVALGPGVTPVLAHNRPLVTVPWTNTWAANPNIPIWIASVDVMAGQPVQPTTANGHIYTAVADGHTGTTQPTFPTGTQSTVTDGTVVWKESGVTGPPAPPGAAFLFFHMGFLWAWGTATSYDANNLDGPDALRMSDLYNFTSWNPLNQTFIGKGDGEVPTGGGVMTLGETGIAATAQIVLFKSSSTYIILGALGPGAQAKRVPTGVGCAAPGSVFFVEELGLVRLSHRGVAVFDGQNDVVAQYTEPIRPYLFGGSANVTPIDWANIIYAKSARIADPPAYILACPLPSGSTTAQIGTTSVTAGAVSATITFPVPVGGGVYTPVVAVSWNTAVGVASSVSTGLSLEFDTPVPAGGGTVYWGAVQATGGGLSRLFIYHISLQAWAVVDLPWNIASLAYIPENPYPTYTLVGGSSDGCVRRIFAGDPDWDGLPIRGSFTIPEIGNPITPSYIKEVAVSGRAKFGQPCGFTGCVLQYTDRSGLVLQENLFVPGNQIPMYIDVDKTVISGSLQIRAQGPLVVEGLEIAVQPKAYQGIDHNRDGGGVTLNPPDGHGGGTAMQAYFTSGSSTVSAGATQVAVPFSVGLAGSNYLMSLSASWITSDWVVGRTTTAATVQFGTPAPAGGGIVFWSVSVPTTVNRVGTQNVGAGSVFSVVTFVNPVATAYTPEITPNWNTNWWITALGTTGFTVAFSAPAPPAGGSFVYQPVGAA